MSTELTGLALLRKPFDKSQISKLPKPTKQQTEIVRNDFKQGIRCQLCGAWHHKDVVHLDYVGHAALTNRLLECDPDWNWEPLAVNDKGLPQYDSIDGLWIKLTVCGVTRLGYGDAQGKSGGDAIKEMIGDALRNAAMRFGAALDLWSKADLHAEDEKELPVLTDEKFNQKSKAWMQSIASGKTTVDKLIDYIKENAKPTDEQINEIKSWSIK